MPSETGAADRFNQQSALTGAACESADAASEISLIMPCYCEQDVIPYTIPRLLQAFAQAGHRLELVACDNGSTESHGRGHQGVRRRGPAGGLPPSRAERRLRQRGPAVDSRLLGALGRHHPRGWASGRRGCGAALRSTQAHRRERPRQGPTPFPHGRRHAQGRVGPLQRFRLAALAAPRVGRRQRQPQESCIVGCSRRWTCSRRTGSSTRR